MQKRICLSEYEVRAFYTDRKGVTCKDLGVFYGCRINRGDKEPADRECALCKRLADFRRHTRKEE